MEIIILFLLNLQAGQCKLTVDFDCIVCTEKQVYIVIWLWCCIGMGVDGI